MKKTLKRILMCTLILGIFIMMNTHVFADFYSDAFNWFSGGREQ